MDHIRHFKDGFGLYSNTKRRKCQDGMYSDTSKSFEIIKSAIKSNKNRETAFFLWF